LQTARKLHENIRNSPITFIGGLWKTHSVMCSKLMEVHANKNKLG